MADYSYKELCYQIPEYINKAFVDEFKREPDGDPGYDGDCWTLAEMYVDDLIKQRDELLGALEAAVECGIVPSSSAKEGGAAKYARQVVVADQIRDAIAKAKGGAA